MVKLNYMHRKQTGFTIVELLIVIVVIGILAAITIVAFNGIQERARDAKRQSNIQAVAKALEMYYVDNGRYPNFGSGMSSTAWVQANLNLSPDVVIAPGDSPATGTSSFVNATTSTDTNKYGYWNRGGTHAAPTSCDGTIGCQLYTLGWYSEAQDSWQTVRSSNG